MDEINERRRDRSYVDINAAMEIHGQASKKDLEDSPFVKYSELGINNEGYWTFNHMAVQFEDCVDCLKMLFPHFDFVVMFDHSQGHAETLAYGLDPCNMNKSFGGAQPRMRESQIKQHDGYLGIHDKRTLDVGDVQLFSFRPEDDGPFWMTPDQKESNRHDQILQPRAGRRVPKRNKTILELKAELAPLRILNDRRQYLLTELQELANNNNIDTQIERMREKKGCQGQQKGTYKFFGSEGGSMFRSLRYTQWIL